MMATLVGAFQLPREPRFAGDARTEIRKLIAPIVGYAADPDVSDLAEEIALCGSELFANAAGYGAGRVVQISVTEVGASIRVEVHDDGTNPLAAADDDLFSEHGRGLLIVQALSSDSGIRQDASGTTAWFEKVIR